MPLVKDVIEELEDFAPQSLAESWDNVGLQVGDPNSEVKRIVLAVDCDAAALQLALDGRRKAQLLITHHPLLFKPLSGLTFDTPQGQLVRELVKQNIALYCAHTNADNSLKFGASRKLAALIDLSELAPLGLAEQDTKVRLSFFVPEAQSDAVALALMAAGVQDIELAAVPLLKPGAKEGELASESHVAMAFECAQANTSYYRERLQQALGGAAAHLTLTPLANRNTTYSAGVTGTLKQLTAVEALAEGLAGKLGARAYGLGNDPQRKVQHIAIVAGSGSSFVAEVAERGAELFITGELGFHQAQDALQRGLSIVVLGHAISEQPTILAMQEFLSAQFPNLEYARCEPKEPLAWRLRTTEGG